MSQANTNEIDSIICMICLQEVTESKKCLGCQNQYCKLCVLQWKKQKNICPLKCVQGKWLINLDDVNEQNSDGFIVCPFDNNIGNLNCRECKKCLLFNKLERQVKYKCKNCQNILEYYENSQEGHDNCKNIYSNIYYYYCTSCDLKICNCIENEIGFQ
ncbi:hypothetical protein ABPG74_015184 [Tetrahymena malaccensis]